MRRRSRGTWSPLGSAAVVVVLTLATVTFFDFVLVELAAAYRPGRTGFSDLRRVSARPGVSRRRSGFYYDEAAVRHRRHNSSPHNHGSDRSRQQRFPRTGLQDAAFETAAACGALTAQASYRSRTTTTR